MNWKCLTLTAAVLGVAAASPAMADQLDTITANKVLRCATFADVVPFAAPDPKTREMAGFDVDLCKAIAKELGSRRRSSPYRSRPAFPK